MNDPMALLSQGSGGRFFHNNNDLGRGFRELAAAPEVSYLLGFSPANLKPDGRYHNLKVTLAGLDHLKVDARRGYFAPDKSKPPQLTRAEKFDAAVLAADDIAGMPVEITTHSEKLDSGERVLKAVIHVDVRSLTFLRRADRRVQRLRFVTALFDPQGNFLAGVEAEMDLALKDATLASLSTQGLDQKLSLQAPPGMYRLRAVVQELAQGKVAALSRPVEIR